MLETGTGEMLRDLIYSVKDPPGYSRENGLPQRVSPRVPRKESFMVVHCREDLDQGGPSENGEEVVRFGQLGCILEVKPDRTCLSSYELRREVKDDS